MSDVNDGETAMTDEMEASDPIIEYAATGRIVTFPTRDAVLSIGNMEILNEIREGDHGFELTYQSRNDTPRVLIASPDLEVVRKYLLTQLCIDVRYQRRLRAIRFPGSPGSLPEGFMLDETVDGWVLRWGADGEPCVAIFPQGSRAESEAAKFTSVARHSEEEIIASLEHPGGRPLFLIR